MDNLNEFLIKPVGSQLMRDLKTDLENFFSKEACMNHCKQDIFNSEADIQLRLVEYLKSLNKYNRVMVEYKVPKKIYEFRLSKLGFQIPSPIYPWHNDIRIDIVVERGGEFVPIELKYATVYLKGQDLFGEEIEYAFLTNHDAYDLNMYKYWKDVRRIEMSSLVFKNVVGGFAILVTNSDTYIKPPRPKVAYKDFSTCQDRIVGKEDDNILLDWDETNKKLSQKIKEQYPEFILEGLYTCDWKSTCMHSEEKRNLRFDYLMIEVDKIPTNLYGPHKFAAGQKTTVKDLVDWFKKETNLVLKVYKGRKPQAESELLTSCGGKKGYITFRTSIMVQNLEKRFKERLNLDVKIFTKDANVQVLSGITIATAAEIPAGATKKSMEKYIGYKRK